MVTEIKTVGIVGLGLIGGSFAKAIKAQTGHVVYGVDIDGSVLYKAQEDRVIDGVLCAENIADCELILIALYPRDAVAWLKENGGRIAEGTIVIDCCGVKRFVDLPMRELAQSHGFTYVGGHPMAGREFFGYDASTGAVFYNARMILIDPPQELLPLLEQFFTSIGFQGLQLAAAGEHDRKIAYTSQLTHIAASAYIKSPTAMEHTGFSAGSFHSMTRVAYLNEDMWAELFLENRDYLLEEIHWMQEHLKEYETALENGDEDALRALLRDGRVRKEKAEGLER